MEKFIKSLFILSLVFPTVLVSIEHSPFAFFHPPKDWLMCNPDNFKDGVKIGFIQSKRKIFTPAISLSTEKIACNEQTYIEAVKKNHRSDNTKSCCELGLIETKSGKAHLLQIDMKNTWGKIRILQAILIKNEYAYIETATCLQEDFLKIHQRLLDSLQSLTIVPNLPSSIENHEDLEKNLRILKTSWKKYLATAKGKKEDLFRESFFQKNQWLPFIDYITKNYKKLGICWQILAIQHVKNELMNL